MKYKIPFITYLFFILVYANQGISGLSGQCIYYLTRETWKLSATMLGWVGLLIGLAWYIKPLFGVVCDSLPIKNYRTKYYLYINYIFIILASLYIIIFGLNLISLVVVFMLINFAIAFNDVANDTQMVILEQKYKLQGKIQAIQWTSLAVMGLIVSLGGAWIANNFNNNIGYRVATIFTIIIPVITLIYLFKFYKERPVRKIGNNFKNLKNSLKYLKNKSFIMGLLFIFFLQFCPSFGNALMIRMRETMLIDKMFIGYLGAVGTIFGIIGYLLYYWKYHKIDMKKLLYFTVIFSGLSNLAYLYLPSKWAIMTYSIVFGIFGGITWLIILAYMAKIIPVGVEGLFYALVTSVSNFSGHLSGVTGGMIYDHFGYNWTVIIASVTTLLCIFFIPHLNLKEETNG